VAFEVITRLEAGSFALFAVADSVAASSLTVRPAPRDVRSNLYQREIGAQVLLTGPWQAQSRSWAVLSDSTLDGIIVGLNRIYSLGSIAGSPAIAGGTLYVGSTKGILYAIGS
jgi:PQQ-like domain